MGAYPGSLTTEDAVQKEMQARWRAESGLHKDGDSHLRSIKAGTGYHIQATDGEIGHVENMLLDDHTWAIR